MDCLTWKEIEEYLSDELSSSSRSRYDEHFASCSDCKHALGDARENLELARPLRELIQSKSSQPSSVPSSLGAPPARIGRYEIVGELGRGGMGVVYEAIDPELERTVALKCLPQGLVATRGSLERLRKEAKLLATVNHVHLATVHSLERDGEQSFLTMERVDGSSLRDLLKDGRFSPVAAGAVARQVAAALVAAHGHGIIHRDLKPANIVVSPEGWVKVLDLGLARLSSEPDSVFGLSGTPGYMSPELIADGRTTEKSDLFALGCTLFEMLTGDKAIPGATRAECLSRTLESEPNWSALPDAVSKRLRELVERLLEKDPAARPESARDVEELLATIQEEELLRRKEGNDAGRSAPTPPTYGERSEDDSSQRGQGATLESSGSVLGNLPGTVSSFIGRDGECVAITSSLLANKIVTLTGPAGSGKTRLAIELARGIADRYTGGVWWVDLSAIRSEEDIASSVARTLGIRDQAESPIDHLVREHLASRQILLVLDNCERWIEAVARYTMDWVGAAQELRVLITTRQPVRIAGETVHRIGPLRFHPDPGQARLMDLQEMDAERLFLDRLRSIDPMLEWTDDDAPRISGICRRLDGLPLALELMAVRVASLGLEESGARLDRRFALLSEGDPTSASHHQTLRSMVDWSYEPLSDREKQLFARLAVFEGSWDLRDAEAVCHDDALDRSLVLDLLVSLVTRSLVEIEPRHGRGRNRYRMLETIREYGQERLRADSDLAASLRERHFDHFLTIARDVHSSAPGSPRRWRALDDSHTNLTQALHHAVASPKTHPRLLELVGSLADFWAARGFWREGCRWLEAVLTSEHVDRRSRTYRAALTRWGSLTYSLGDLEKGVERTEASLLLARDLQDRSGESDALMQLGTYAFLRGDGAVARQSLEPCLEIRRANPEETPYSRSRLARTLSAIGATHLLDGSLGEARTHFEEALAIQKKSGDRLGEADVMNNLGMVLANLGDLDAARAIHEQCLERRREFGHRPHIAKSLANLGYVSMRQGRLHEAESLTIESAEIYREVGDRSAASWAMNNLGIINRRLGRHLEAERSHKEAGELQEEIGDRLGHVSTWLHRAELALLCDRPEEARELAESGISLSRSIEDRRGTAKITEFLGRVSIRLEEWDRADRELRDGLEIRAKSEQFTKSARLLLSRAAAAERRGDAVTAIRWMGAAERARELARGVGFLQDAPEGGSAGTETPEESESSGPGVSEVALRAPAPDQTALLVAVGQETFRKELAIGRALEPAQWMSEAPVDDSGAAPPQM